MIHIRQKEIMYLNHKVIPGHLNTECFILCKGIVNKNKYSSVEYCDCMECLLSDCDDELFIIDKRDK